MGFVVCIREEEEEWPEGGKFEQGLGTAIVYEFYN